jgi:ACS family tartrate transporter-like MFS transporter
MSTTTNKLHGLSTGAVTPAAEIEKRTMKRVATRLVPFLMLCYVFCWMNRINLSFAAVPMGKQLGLSATDYGLAAGLFFVTYALLEIPSNLLLHKYGARKWIARIMFSWGVVAAGMALVAGPNSFYLMRLLLGAAEAGFYPGILFFLTLWVPAAYRARTYSVFLLAIPLTGIIGGPLSVHLLDLNGTLGLAGWQWMFIVEGLPSAILAPFVLFYLQDRPNDAHWLANDEKTWLIDKLATEKQTIDLRSAQSVLAALTNPTVVLMALMYFSNVCILNGILFFLPQIVKGFGLTMHQVGDFMIIPNVLALVLMIIWGRRSDRKQERFGHAAAANMVAAVALLGAMTIQDPWLRGAAFSIAFAATLCMVVPFWAIPGAFLSGASAAGGIAAISAMGVTGGFVAPYFIGYMKDVTGSFTASFLSIAVFGVVISGLFYVVGNRQQRDRDAANAITDAKV